MSNELPSVKTPQEARAAIEMIERRRTERRRKERELRAKLNTMSSYPVLGGEDLAPNLVRALPPHLVPKNVGDLNDVMWDFTFTVVIDAGIDPVFNKAWRKEGLFRVDQEAAFMLYAYSRNYRDVGSAGRGAPIQLNFRDAQSTRQFNNEVAFPIQVIGERGLPTLLDTPLTLTKNSTFMVEAHTRWLPEEMETIGDGYQEITFYGMRVRDEDGAKTLATMFL